jgi:phage terminase Nu1 subunit (DNA packaging protein)
LPTGSNASRHRGRLLNWSEVADFFGCSIPTVDRWIRKGCPVVRRPSGRGHGANQWQFDSAAMIAWLREEGQADAGQAQMDMAEARRRRAAAEASLAELGLAKARGEMLPVRDVEIVWGRVIGNVKPLLLAIPARLSFHLSGVSDSPL